MAHIEDPYWSISVGLDPWLYQLFKEFYFTSGQQWEPTVWRLPPSILYQFDQAWQFETSGGLWTRTIKQKSSVADEGGWVTWKMLIMTHADQSVREPEASCTTCLTDCLHKGVLWNKQYLPIRPSKSYWFKDNEYVCKLSGVSVLFSLFYSSGKIQNTYFEEAVMNV